MPKTKLILAATLALAAATGGAQTVWRCGNSYSTQPCAGGSSFEAERAPARAEAERAARAAQSDARRADTLEKARLAQEKAAPKAVVIAPAEAPKAAPGAAGAASNGKKTDKPGGKLKPLETFTAVAPGTGKKARKAK